MADEEKNDRLLQEIELSRSWMKKYDARQDAIRIAEQRVRALEQALGLALQWYAGPVESVEALNDVLLDVPKVRTTPPQRLAMGEGMSAELRAAEAGMKNG